MVSSIGTSLNGLQAATKRIEVSANNIANQNSSNYKTQAAQQVSRPNGAVEVNVKNAGNPTQKQYSPDDPGADEAGFITTANVDPAKELVDLNIASYDFKANLKALEIADKNQKTLLDIIA